MATITAEIFPHAQVHELFTEPRRVRFETPVRFMYMAVQPNAGCDDPRRVSDFVIMTIANDTLVGLDALDIVHPSEYKDVLINHLSGLRTLHNCGNATLVLSVESGTGLEAGHITQLVQDHYGGNVHALSTRVGKPGVSSTFDRGMRMFNWARSELIQGEYQIMNKLVTSQTPLESAATLIQLRDQMLRLELINDGKRRRISTRGPEGSERNDLIWTWLYVLYAPRQFVPETIRTPPRQFAPMITN